MISNFKDPKYTFLSNMYPCMIDCGMLFKCVESAYRAAKCAREQDKLQFVLLDGYAAKKLGRTILRRPDWNDVRVPTMKRLLQLKFP